MKNQINEFRLEIDKVDATLINLLDKRADLAKAIGRIKRKNNLPIFNKSREEEILAKTQEAKNKGFLLNIFKKIMQESRKLQEKIK